MIRFLDFILRQARLLQLEKKLPTCNVCDMQMNILIWIDKIAGEELLKFFLALFFFTLLLWQQLIFLCFFKFSNIFLLLDNWITHFSIF